MTLQTAQRIKKEYGSIKAAFEHCIDLKLTLAGTARQLECSTTFVIWWENRLGIKIPRGIKGGQKGHPGNPNSIAFVAYNAQRARKNMERIGDEQRR